MANFATENDVSLLWREIQAGEKQKVNALLEVVSNRLRVEALKVGVDLDAKVEKQPSFSSVLKSVVVDIVARSMMTPTSGAPLSQMSESGMGYSFSGTFLNPGGGLFIKDSELKILGLKKQRVGVIELYG